MTLRHIASRVFFTFAGVALSGLLVEGLWRVLPVEWTSERTRFYQYDSQIGWIGRPNASGTFRTSDFSTWVQLNSKGLRANEIPYERSHKERRILVLGDSFVWGFGVNAEDRFTEALQNNLRDTTVINAGVSGYGTDQELLLFSSEGRKYSADTVIVTVHLRSDVKNNHSSIQYGSQKPVAWSNNNDLTFKNIPVAMSSWGQATVKAFQKHSAFLGWLCGRQLKDRKVGTFISDLVNKLIGDQEPPQIESNYSPATATCKLASILAKEIAASGAQVAFLVVPDVRPDTRVIEEKPEYEEIRRCLSEMSVTVVDLTKNLSEMLRDDSRTPVVFQHDLHWTPTTHKMIGKLLAEALASTHAK